MAQPARDAPASPDPLEKELDEDIQSIRAEIRTLQRRKRFLASSLLSSDSVQKLTRKLPPALTSIHDEVSPLIHAAGKHSELNHYRIGFGTTAFPFKDPSPAAPTESLLGVRIDICARNGRFAKPYYVLLKSEHARGEVKKRLCVHRHTIPAFIALSKLESVYLPFPVSRKVQGEDDHGEESDGEAIEALKPVQKGRNAGGKQDLRGFVRELRRELVAWHLRTDAIELLREKLGLSEESQLDPAERLSPEARGGIVSLALTALEARYVRMEWEDGRVGRFKLSNTGIVERAVVIGDGGRDKQTENAMTGAGGRVESLLDRLQRRDSRTA
ncbi:uncharacterized protein N7482_009638 [Penicillium canariense]|uniref:Centromere protein Cenp-O n=1 Tax=Penicillium canariense TaxID=189055 RepID=A0A9W9HR87_9EURO|nr:uncharacterized protein N7482_009638 [Penicillium canariense]KAJ5153160.1 hypothetical protein N7482_009638 [Penicillium canariense]